MDSAIGVVRHATFVESRYCAVFITPDNVQTLLQSTKQTRKQQLCRLILNHMSSDSIILDLPTLVSMEKQWTGNARLAPPGYLSDMKFYSVVSCTNYISGNWHQVRELYVVAIAEGAWAAIVEASKLKKGRGKAQKPLANIASLDSMITTLKSLQAGSPAQILLAAITRRAVKIHTNLFSSALCKVVPDDGTFRDIVHYIYKFFKKGNLEPPESFIRVSKSFNQQHLLQFDVEPASTIDEPLHVTDNGYVLISSTYHHHDPEKSKSNICVYIVKGEPTPPTQEQLFERLMDTIETRDVYHTTGHNGTSNLYNFKDVPWNLKQTYGIYSNPGFQFLHFLTGIGKTIGNYNIPATQGSPRALAKSGSYIFTRNIIPWNDPRLIGGYVEERAFILYRLITSEISYWKKTAELLNAKGIACCQICATPIKGDIGTCFQCMIALRDYDGTDWITNVFQCKPPFPENNEDSDSSDSDHEGFGYYRGRRHQDQWKRSLAGYPRLNESFENLSELLSQHKEFSEWSSEKVRAEWRMRGTKRKRQEEDGE